MLKQYRKKSLQQLTACDLEDQLERPDPFGFIARENAKIAELMQEKDANGNMKHPHLMEYLNYIQPKKSDCKRVFTTSELKELCLRVKCRVRMELCNPCEDYTRRLLSEGRLQNKTREYINKLLTKAVMRHKAAALYTQEDIDNHRRYQWPFRLRYNILNLNLWKHERGESVNNDAENLAENRVNFEESEVSYVATQALNEMIANETDDSYVDTQDLDNMIAIESEVSRLDSQTLNQMIVNASEVSYVDSRALNPIIANESDVSNVDSQALDQMVGNESEVIVIDESLVDPDQFNANDNVQIDHVDEILRGEDVENNDENDEIIQDDNVYSEHVIETSYHECDVITTSELEKYSSKFSTEQEDIVVPNNNSDLIKGAYEVNTESMTIDEQSYLQSQGDASEPIPYEVFNSQIPSTSTQSQPQGKH